MKTFQQFCSEAYQVQELFGFGEPPKPNTNVLAYKNYQPGVLDKSTGKFTQRPHTGEEQKRYGWKPVNVSSYSKADTPGSTTASGHKFDDKQKLVAVPYASRTSSRPSTPFGTKLNITRAPGVTPVAKTSVQDTGNFGPAGDYNKRTSYDLSLSTARDVSGNQNLTSQQFGKQKVYVRNEPGTAAAKPTNKK
jgi:hypothetical protein